MRVSQQLDYALRMLVALGQRSPESPAAAGDIADSLGLPRRFGEQQMTALGKAGLVEPRRGTGGGVTLAKRASEITVLDVVLAVQGEVLDVPKVPSLATTELWADLALAAELRLAETSLADLVARQNEIDATRAPMYFI